MKTISKSDYTRFKQCPKRLWLFLNKKEEYVEDPDAKRLIENGKVVGQYAKEYFKDTVDTTSFKGDGSLDTHEMLRLTDHYLQEKKGTIAEASFSLDGLFCSVDLLHAVEGGYEIYEVKAGTGLEDEHYADAAFQKFVLGKKGLNIVGTYILHLNNEYRRKGDLELDQLFVAEKLDDKQKFLGALGGVEGEIKAIHEILSSKEEPDLALASRCKKCPFKGHCQKEIPVPSVLDVNGLRGYTYLNRGIVTYQDLQSSDARLNKRQKTQIDAYFKQETVIIDKKGIKDFLKSIRYPIYYLDFESIELPIPPADNTWPYEQIPTQYSLHIEQEDGTLEHKEFLGDSIDPRREIAKSLCNSIPMNACIIAFNKNFECGRLDELAELYPDLKEHLSNIGNNVADLIVPFRDGSYYHKDMGGSNSIKAVLPALYPNDPELDYHALPVVHQGGEAMDIYPKMLEAEPAEKKRIRDGLFQYCRLDTLAMVKILRKIKEQAE